MMQSEAKGAVAIIGARKGSKRLPGKNKKPLCGKPLFQHTVEAALEARVFDQIVVTSDDEDILGLAARFDGVTVHQRPAELATDEADMWTVARFVLEALFPGPENIHDICVLNLCYPFRGALEIRRAHERFHGSGAPGLLSIAAYPFPPALALDMADGYIHRGWTGLARPAEHPQRYFPAGGIAFVQGDHLRREGTVYSDRTLGFEVTWPAWIDIDVQADFELAERLCGQILR